MAQFFITTKDKLLTVLKKGHENSQDSQGQVVDGTKKKGHENSQDSQGQVVDGTKKKDMKTHKTAKGELLTALKKDTKTHKTAKGKLLTALKKRMKSPGPRRPMEVINRLTDSTVHLWAISESAK